MFYTDAIFDPDALGRKKLTLLKVYREHKDLIDKIAKYAGIDAALAQLLGIAIKKFFTNPEYVSLEFGNLFALVKKPRKVNINLKRQGYIPENLFGRDLLDKLVNEKGMDKFSYVFLDIRFVPRELVKEFMDTSKYQAVIRELRKILTDREYKEMLKKTLEEEMSYSDDESEKDSGKSKKSRSFLAKMRMSDIPDVIDEISQSNDISSASKSLKYFDKDYKKEEGE